MKTRWDLGFVICIERAISKRIFKDFPRFGVNLSRHFKVNESERVGSLK